MTYSTTTQVKEIESLINEANKISIYIDKLGKFVKLSKEDAMSHIIIKAKNWYGNIDLRLNQVGTLYVAGVSVK